MPGISKRLSTAVAIGAVLATLTVGAGSAQAAFHLMKVSEVYPGTNSTSQDAFIELQMHTAGQNFVLGHDVDYYTAYG